MQSARRVRHRIAARLIGVALHVAGAASAETAPPEHDAWQRAVQRAGQAMAAGDLEVAREAALVVSGEVLRFADTDPRIAQSFELLDALVGAHRKRGLLEPLDALCEEIGKRAETAGAPASRLALAMVQNRADLATLRGRGQQLVQVLGLHKEKIDASVGVGQPAAVFVSSLLALAYAETEQFRRARAELDAALENAKRALGPEHPTVGWLQIVRSRIEVSAARPEEGVAAATSAVGILERGSGASSRQASEALARLAEAEYSAGAFEAAATSLERLRLAGAVGGNRADRIAAAKAQIAEGLVQLARGDLEAAQRAATSALAGVEESDGADSPLVADALLVQASIHDVEGRLHEAIAVQRRAVGILTRTDRLASGHGIRAQYQLAALEVRSGQRDTARISFDEAAERARRQWGDDSLVRARALDSWARALAETGRPDEAAPLAEESLRIARKHLGAENPGLASYRLTLAVVRRAEGRAGEARGLLAEALSAAKRRPLPYFEEEKLLEHHAANLASLGEERGATEIERRLEAHRGRATRGSTSETGVSEPAASAVEVAGQNFRYQQHAGSNWRPWDARLAGNPAAALGLMRTQPAATYFVISANEVAADVTLENGASFVKSGVEGKGNRVSSQEGHAVNGMDGVRMLVESPAGTNAFVMVTWLTVQGGFFYNLSFWAAPATYSRSELFDEAQRAFGGFTLIDATRVARGPGRPAGRFRSDRWGYEIDLEGTPWVAWDTLAAQFPHGDFGALLGQQAAFTVVPVTTVGIPIEPELLARGFMALVNGGETAKSRPLEGERGVELEFSARQDALEILYRARVVSHEGIGWMALAWTTSPAADEREAHLGVVDRVQFAAASENPPAPDELEPPARLRHRVVLGMLAGVLYQAGRLPDAAVVLAAALPYAEPSDLGLLSDLVQVQLELGRHAELLATLDVHAEAVATQPRLLFYRALAREARGELAVARTDYEAALATGLEDPNLDARYVDLLLRTNSADAALAHVDARLTRGPSPTLRRLRARLLRERGEGDAALSELVALQKEAPRDLDVLYELAETQFLLGRHADVLETVDRIVAAGASSSGALFTRARSQYGLGWYKEAQASLESALQLEPGAQAASQLLDQVKAMLGEGSNLAVRQPLDPVELPAEIRGRLEPAKQPTAAPAHGAFLLYHVVGIRWAPGDEIRTTTWWKARILDRKGLDGFGSLQVDFDPLGEELFVNQLIVSDASGKEVSRGRIEDFYVLDAPAQPVATQRKLLNLPVRGLEPGMTVELVVTRRERPSTDRFTFFEHLFSLGVPVARGAAFVNGGVDDLVYQASPGIEQKRTKERIEWWIEEPPVARWEPMQPPPASYLPALRVADRRDSWQEMARGYLEEIGGVLAASPEVVRIASEATRGALSAGEKAHALAAYVQRQLSYKAIAFGRRARIPSGVDEVLDRRYGDCKDHSLLLHQLLASAGLRSELVLASLGDDIDPRLPSLDQFDHMIVRCADCAGSHYLDVTDKGTRAGTDVPRGLAGKAVLVLDPAESRLETLPSPDPEQHRVSSKRTIEVQNEGGVVVREELRMAGYAAAQTRDLLRAFDRPLWTEVLGRSLGQAGLEVRELEVDAFDDAEQPLGIRAHYFVPAVFSRSSGGLVGRVPSLFEGLLLRIDPAPERAAPFEVSIPLRVESRARLVPPKGFALAGDAPLPGSRAVGRFARWKGVVAASNGSLDLRFHFRRRAGRFAAAEFQPYRGEVEGALEFLGRSVTLAPLAED